MLFVLLLFSNLFILILGGWYPSISPPYCSEVDSYFDILGDARSITPLSTDELAKVKELVQVQVMIRHGSRTPYNADKCWENYEVSWQNCEVTELVLPSASNTTQSRMAPWLFRKLYDAFEDLLGGHCYTGQLIEQGFTQESQLGQLFRNTYTPYPTGTGIAYDEKIHLFKNNSFETMLKDELYFRSTDVQRTLMSGQVFVYNMFNVSADDTSIVDWHTGDNEIDPLSPSSGSCPYLAQIQSNAFSDPTFIATNQSMGDALESFVVSQLGAAGDDWYWGHCTDCFMTAICPDKGGIPGDSWTDDLFNQTLAMDQYSYFWQMKYNNSEWSRLGMSDIVYHVNKYAQELQQNKDSAKKFVLYSAHDTSVIPFVDALIEPGQTIDSWAPYASYVSIEMYEAVDSDPEDFYFRAVYNGQPLKLYGCTTAGLCGSSVFLTKTTGWGELNGGSGCQRPITSSSDVTPIETSCGGDDDKNTVTLNAGAFFGVVLLCVAFGAVVTGVVFKYKSWQEVCPPSLAGRSSTINSDRNQPYKPTTTSTPKGTDSDSSSGSDPFTPRGNPIHSNNI